MSNDSVHKAALKRLYDAITAIPRRRVYAGDRTVNVVECRNPVDQRYWDAWRELEHAQTEALSALRTSVNNTLTLSSDEINLIREWFDRVTNCDPGYLEAADRALGTKIRRFCGFKK